VVVDIIHILDIVVVEVVVVEALLAMEEDPRLSGDKLNFKLAIIL
jgi:hypothetical protein